jgi:ankyrin repeat protein
MRILNINVQNKDGNTALMFAVQNNRKKAVEFLLSKSVKVDS